jgi:hypothetical protein
MRWWPWSRRRKTVTKIELHAAVAEAAELRRVAELRLQATQARTPRVQELADRLDDQLHNKNHIGRLFDHAFRGHTQ